MHNTKFPMPHLAFKGTWLVIIMILVSFNTTQATSSQNATAESDSIFSSSIINNEYIVSFFNYMTSEDQKAILQALLPIKQTWELLTRKTALKGVPSDFALIRTLLKDDSSLVSSLRGDKQHIKRVTPQRRFVGILSGTVEDSFDPFSDLISVVKEKTQNGRYFRFPDGYFTNVTSPNTGRRLHNEQSIPDRFNAHMLWEKGYTGRGVKVAVFDTGIRANHPHLKNVVERTDWTDESELDDKLGHGSCVTGLIASKDTQCKGFAPDVEIYSFRVFTEKKVSFTSWFLDAFNYAIHKKINILNLSIGGPDFMDEPFVDKVWEMSGNNIIVVSAIGNDGPLYGTLNNPADQMDVIGVGGVTFDNNIAKFSSRGMTTWELPGGYGRIKPDILAYGEDVIGSGINGGCQVLSGTSVASPVVAGAVALLSSTIEEERRWQVVNPASIKQVLLESAHILPGVNVFEQGMGKMDLIGAYKALQEYEPRASFAPSTLDLTSCPYMWPFCSQPLYHGQMPLIVNVTILNGMSAQGEILGSPRWVTMPDKNVLEVHFDYPDTLWPWTGALGIRLKVMDNKADWIGTVEGKVEVDIRSPPLPGSSEFRTTTISLPIKVNVTATPPREKRILWDQYHNLHYPGGYFPRDALWWTQEPFDWNGDHIHTNFRKLYNFLREQGYFVEVLGQPYTCFDPSQYGTLLIVDPEEEFFPSEIDALKKYVDEGLSVMLFADWYSEEVIENIKFYDENTKQWWTPVTGGANVPAINDLLKPWDIAFGNQVYDGDFRITSHKAHFASGVAIARFPRGGTLIPFEFTNQGQKMTKSTAMKHTVPVIGFYNPGEAAGKEPTGTIAIFGDSSCLDEACSRREERDCYWLLREMLKVTAQRRKSDFFSAFFNEPLIKKYKSKMLELPTRVKGNNLAKYSKVLGHTLSCSTQEYKRFDQSQQQQLDFEWPDYQAQSLKHANVFRQGAAPLPNAGHGWSFFLGLMTGAVVFTLCLGFLYVNYKNKKQGTTYREIRLTL